MSERGYEEGAHCCSETEGRLRERVDHENDHDDSEEDAVDVDVWERRPLVLIRALSF